MRRSLAAAMAALLAYIPIYGPAAANPLCGDRAAMLTKLAREFGEAPSALGLASSGGVVELLTSETGSWTLMITFAPSNSGPSRTCLIATGEGWQSHDASELPPGDRRPGAFRFVPGRGA